MGRIVDSRGTRILFVCAFLFLLGGYSGIRYIYDKGIPEDATSLSMFSFSLLILFGFMTGAGNNCGITSALNTIAKTFPDRMVCCMSCHFVTFRNLFLYFFCSAHPQADWLSRAWACQPFCFPPSPTCSLRARHRPFCFCWQSEQHFL